MSRIAEAMLDGPYHGGLPGHKEPTTSREAATAVLLGSRELRDLVLATIKQRPRTSDEVAEALNRSPFLIRPRVSELRKLKLVRPLAEANGKTVRRRNASSGLSATVWDAVR